MSGRTGYRGARRTRVYDANYNIGERYYKSALDDLDRKYNTTSGPSIADRIASNRAQSCDVAGDLFSARQRANKAILENGVFDNQTRSGRLSRPTAAALDMEDDFDEQIKSSLDRIRASKKMVSMMDDLDIDDQISSMKRKAKLDFGSKLDADDEDFTSSIRSRGLKAITSRTENVMDSSNFSSGVEEFKSAASNRARVSKARLDDLESEMFERTERQAARDKRSANLKKFLADNEFDSEQSAQQSMKLSARSEKKMVTF